MSVTVTLQSHPSRDNCTSVRVMGEIALDIPSFVRSKGQQFVEQKQTLVLEEQRDELTARLEKRAQAAANVAAAQVAERQRAERQKAERQKAKASARAARKEREAPRNTDTSVQKAESNEGESVSCGQETKVVLGGSDPGKKKAVGNLAKRAISPGEEDVGETKGESKSETKE